MPPSAGMRFGRYELVSRLGVGGMGEVWRARDQDLHRDVAVKFLPEHFASDPLRMARFDQEARAASSLTHPNIVTIHEIGSTPGNSYLVMEYIDGVGLDRVIRSSGRMSVERAAAIGVQVADALAFAHKHNVIHRDIKPANILMSAPNWPMLADFGIAKLRDDQQRLTMPGLVIGTAAIRKEGSRLAQPFRIVSLPSTV